MQNRQKSINLPGTLKTVLRINAQSKKRGNLQRHPSKHTPTAVKRPANERSTQNTWTF